MKKLKLHGPVSDGMFSCWQVIGPRGGVIGEFITRKTAREFIKSKQKTPIVFDSKVCYKCNKPMRALQYWEHNCKG